ncbi:MAG: histidine kinase [Lachnospiraceae bacterium]|nr:histidine kinase [Lachnospiraceae bacterium]
MEQKKAGKNFPIRFKLIALFICTTLFISVINIYMYKSLKQAISKIDKVYTSNEFLNSLSGNLDQVQKSMFLYLDTKNSKALKDYYRYAEEYKSKVGQLQHKPTDDPTSLLEKNIYYMSYSYLDMAEETVSLKRKRNVEKLQLTYQESDVLYKEISAVIRNLNNKQFQNNSEKYAILRNALNYLSFIFAGVLVIVIIINIFMIIIITRSMMNPLVILAQAANKVAQGNFDVLVAEPDNRDEIGVVSRAFNKMIGSIRTYIKQITENYERESEMKQKELLMENDLKDAQLKYLQAQINPHFLFNTLNAGAQLAMMEGAEKTCIFVENMADFFRYNVRKIDTDSTLEEEIQLVDNYVYILNVRFSGEIHFHKQVDNKLLTTKVPSMIVQPIVENAINHGIRMMEGEGSITLSVYQEGGHVCISIKDNGVGIDEQTRKTLLKGQGAGNKSEQDATGIGLDNVINRMRRYYNTADVIAINGIEGKSGTEIILFIPIEV